MFSAICEFPFFRQFPKERVVALCGSLEYRKMTAGRVGTRFGSGAWVQRVFKLELSVCMQGRHCVCSTVNSLCSQADRLSGHASGVYFTAYVPSYCSTYPWNCCTSCD